jgi:uncharacterized membrane protein
VVHVALVWDRLPQRLAAHFGPSGAADNWMDRDRFFVMDAVVIAVLVAIPLLIPRLPARFFNLPGPHRDAWRAPENRHALRRTLVLWCNWLIFLVAGFMVYVLDQVVRVNLVSGPPGAAPAPRLDGMGVDLMLFLAATGVWLMGFNRAFRRPPEP